MVHITIYKTANHDYLGFDVEGHAGLAEHGQDVLCAAISMLVINTVNAIERYTDDETTLVSDEESGLIQFRCVHIASHDAHLLLRAMILGLTSLEDVEAYVPYIDIIYEEV